MSTTTHVLEGARAVVHEGAQLSTTTHVLEGARAVVREGARLCPPLHTYLGVRVLWCVRVHGCVHHYTRT